VPAEERVIEAFPVVVRAGLASLPAAGAAEGGGTALPDLPFSPERGYGYVGGTPDRLAAGGLFGGDRTWIPAWREGIEKYVFRVPRGEYIVELTFLETDVAAAGLRVFDVTLEERVVFPRLDVAARAGDFTWLTLRAAASVHDGWLDLRFVPVTAEKPPRVSRIRLLRSARGDRPAPAPEPVRPRARGGPGSAVLWWDPPPSAAIAGYGIFRGDSAAGSSGPLGAGPVELPFFTDHDLEPGKEHAYRVVAIDVWGGQSPLSDPVTASARAVEGLGLRVYDLRIPEDGMRAIGARSAAAAEAEADFRFLGALQRVKARLETSPGDWQRKKTFVLTFVEEPSRAFRQRPAVTLAAEAGDATLLRERLSRKAAAALGLAAPGAEPVALVLNGRYQGVYLDRQPLDRRFRRAARLDTVGLLARRTRGDLLARDWLPAGEQVGEDGNLMALTELIHELNLLEEGEMARYFEERFYLDRLVDRAALAAVRGEMDRTAAFRHYLKDSRNGKWELLEDASRSGDWGIRDFETELHAPAEADGRRMLLGPSLQAGAAPRGGISVLETRFLAVPGLRGRLLDRIERLLSVELSPEKLGEIAAGVFAELKEAGLHDPHRWPADPDAKLFLAAPDAVVASHRARADALRAAIARERSRPPPPLLVNEMLLRPADGPPWLEVMNVSGAPVALADFVLVGEPRAPREEGAEATLPDRALGPGELAVVKLDRSESFPLPASGGGFVGLWRKRRGPGSPVELCDAVFFGHQTAGIARGRLPGPAEPGAWAFLGAPTPGAPNDARRLEPPPYDFRQGVVQGAEGEVKIWFRSREGEGAARPDRIRLHYREEGAAEVQVADLAWDTKDFRFAVSLPVKADRNRTAYWFIATAAGGVERAYPLAAPELTYALPVLPPVRLNEVLPRPGQGSSLGEFIEIYNGSDGEVDLEGFFLSDNRGNSTKWRIPRGNVLPSKGFAVFYADGLNQGNHTSFKLSNSGEFLGLFGRMEEGNLPVDALVFRGMRVGESWGASPDGSKSFKVWRDPTPGARNFPKIPEDFRPAREGEPPPEPGDPPAGEGPSDEPRPAPDERR
jgi:hypothetical protein